MNKKKVYCYKCGTHLRNEEGRVSDLLENFLCIGCAEKENWKAQADKDCPHCKGNGFFVYHQEQHYPIYYVDDINIPCECLQKVKVLG